VREAPRRRSGEDRGSESSSDYASSVNAVNNISAMFILKTQHDYVEATKVVLEPSHALLGNPKSVEEIASYIDADIVED